MERLLKRLLHLHLELLLDLQLERLWEWLVELQLELLSELLSEQEQELVRGLTEDPVGADGADLGSEVSERTETSVRYKHRTGHNMKKMQQSPELCCKPLHSEHGKFQKVLS